MGLRAALDATFQTLPAQLTSPGSGGVVCRAISDLYDTALAERFAAAREGIKVPLALVATGGWARRELAPYSDIDFIVLHDKDKRRRSRSPIGCCIRCGTRSSRSATRSARRGRPPGSRATISRLRPRCSTLGTSPVTGR